MFNHSALMTFTFWSLTSFILAFWHDQIWSTLLLSAFIANISTNLIILTFLIVILLSEFVHHKGLDVTRNQLI
jgi:hypothetical protein